MNPRQKMFTSVIWGVLVVGMVAVIGTGLWARQERKPAVDLPVLYPAPEFQFTNQDGQAVTNEDLRGKVWVAAFIFTNCPDVCPMMAARMAALQKRVEDESVKLVSFTLDPERDTEEVLKKYAQRIGARSGRWNFLRGPEDATYAMAKAMKITAIPAKGEDGAIVHSERLILIDERGMIRGHYSSNEEEAMTKLAADAAALAEAARGEAL